MPVVYQLVKKFSAFYGSLLCSQQSTPSARLIQSTLSHIQGVSRGIVNILGGSSMDYSE